MHFRAWLSLHCKGYNQTISKFVDFIMRRLRTDRLVPSTVSARPNFKHNDVLFLTGNQTSKTPIDELVHLLVDKTVVYNMPSGHMMPKRRCIDVDATSSSRTDVNAT